MAKATARSRPSLPRVLALVLAAGAAFWGGLLLLAFGPAVLTPIPFGFGYVILAGYVVRAAWCPILDARRLIWAASIVVQGGWLCLALAGGPDRAAAQSPYPLAWWACATLGSVVALVAERPDERNNSSAI